MIEGLRIIDGEADTAAIAEYEAGRREALRLGMFAGGAVISATMVPALLGARNAFAQGEDTAESDGEILVGAIGLILAVPVTTAIGVAIVKASSQSS